MRSEGLCAAMALFALGGCGGRTPGPDGQSLEKPVATAEMIDAAGARIGVATFASADTGATLGLSVSGLPAGAHGLHVHEAGSCAAPDFKSAGDHFNPGSKEHGRENPAGPHAGDLPNLRVESDGSADTSLALDPALLGTGPRSILGSQGTALVIHAAADDQRTDPSGESGDRIACGVIERS